MLHCLSCNVKTKQKPNCLKRAKISVVLIILFMMSYQTFMLILFAFFTVAVYESSTRKTISWSVAVYNKTVSSQCNLISQIEQVQDKYHHPTINIEKGVSSNRKDIGRQHGCSPLFLYLSYWDSCLSYDHTTCLHVLNSLWWCQLQFSILFKTMFGSSLLPFVLQIVHLYLC